MIFTIGNNYWQLRRKQACYWTIQTFHLSTVKLDTLK